MLYHSSCPGFSKRQPLSFYITIYTQVFNLFGIANVCRGAEQASNSDDQTHHPPQIISGSDYKSDSPANYRGLTTWSLQAFRGPGYGDTWLNEKNVQNQADIIAKEYLSSGYDYINIGSFWQDQELDKFGRSQLDRNRFPSGMDHLRSFLKSRNLKLGLYYLPGIDARAVNNRNFVKHTNYRADELIFCPNSTTTPSGCQRPLANAFSAGYALNHKHPGSQAYINSIVDQMYEWDVSFVKLDGNVPGSSYDPATATAKCDTQPDLEAWRKAINELFVHKWKGLGRTQKIWLSASWELAQEAGPTLDHTANSWRVAIDIEAYSTVMTTFDRVIRNAKKAALWSSAPTNRVWNGARDLDPLLVSDMSLEESRTMITIWATQGSPLYLGDDLSKLPEQRKKLLIHPEVLEIQHLTTGNPAILQNFNVKNLVPHNFAQDKFQRCHNFVSKRAMIWSSLHTSAQMIPFDSQKDLQSCSSTFDSMKLLQKDTESTMATKNEWTEQIWVAQLSNGDIIIALVNAGHQVSSDQPATFSISLDQLQSLQSSKKTAGRYKWRDVWKQTDLQPRAFNEKFVVTLPVHGSALYKLTPITYDS